jgi:hypothetical protein
MRRKQQRETSRKEGSSMPDSDWDIRAHLQSYVLGQESLRDFQRWFMPIVWTASDRGESTKLMRAVELWLAEYTNGHRSESELRGLFAGLVGGTVTTAKTSARPWSAQPRPMTVGAAKTGAKP